MTKLYAIQGGQPMQDMAEELAERIKDAVYDYADRIPLAVAIGVLEIVKHEILQEAEG